MGIAGRFATHSARGHPCRRHALRRGPWRWSLVTLPVLLLGVRPVLALDVHGGVSTHSQYTDNSRRTHTQQEHDWIHTPQIDLSVEQKNRAFEVNAGYRLEKRQYANNTFSDDTLFTGSSRLDAQVFGDTMRWFLQHNRNQSAVDTRAQNVPTNQQVTNSISSGPQFRWALTARDRVDATLQYQSINASRTSNDSARIALDAQARHQLDEQSSIGLHWNATQVNFQSQFGNDYRSEDVRLTFERDRGERAKLSVEVGGSVVNRDRGRTDRNWVGSLGANYQLSKTWAVNLNLAREATDQAQQAVQGARQFGDLNGQRSDISEAFLLNSLNASVTRTGQRLTGTLAVTASRQSFSSTPRDESRRGTSLHATYQLGPRLTVDAFGSVEVLDFQNFAGHDVQRDGQLRISWQIGRSFNANLGMGISTRDSRRANLNYSEHTGSVGVGYRF